MTWTRRDMVEEVAQSMIFILRARMQSQQQRDDNAITQTHQCNVQTVTARAVSAHMNKHEQTSQSLTIVASLTRVPHSARPRSC